MTFFSETKFEKGNSKGQIPNKHTVLLVDDEEENLINLEGILASEYNVLTAKNGREALALVQNDEDPIRIHLIITDQRMPELTGVEFLSKTISIMPLTIRIILTAFADVSTSIDAINNGHIYKFILKPFDRDDMAITVQRALEAYDLEIENVQLLYDLKATNETLELKVEKRTQALQRALEKQSQLNKAAIEKSKALEEANMRLTYYATTDTLTGLLNRRQFFELSEHEISRSQRNNAPLTVLMLDIDYFKRVNDAYGHAAGDEVLINVANIIKQSMRGQDIPARIGGEEFCILLPETSLNSGVELAERIRINVSKEKIKFGEVGVSISLSAGVSQLYEGETKINDAQMRADGALYKSKNSGRNCVSIEDSNCENKAE